MPPSIPPYALLEPTPPLAQTPVLSVLLASIALMMEPRRSKSTLCTSALRGCFVPQGWIDSLTLSRMPVLRDSIVLKQSLLPSIVLRKPSIRMWVVASPRMIAFHAPRAGTVWRVLSIVQVPVVPGTTAPVVATPQPSLPAPRASTAWKTEDKTLMLVPFAPVDRIAERRR